MSLRKRPNATPQPTTTNKRQKKQDKTNKKDKGKPKAFIPIPGQSEEDEEGRCSSEEEGSDDHQDMIDHEVGLGENAVAFLSGLDKKAITRSRQEQVIENRKARPKELSAPSQAYRSLPKIINSSNRGAEPEENVDDDHEGENMDDLDEDDFALLGSDDDEDDLDMMSDMPSSSSTFDEDISDSDEDFSDEDFSDEDEYLTDDSALEKAYYANKRRTDDKDQKEDTLPTESKLPVKLPDGTIQRFPNHSDQPPQSRAIKSNSSSTTHLDPRPIPPVSHEKKKMVTEDSSYGARFGRVPLTQILTRSKGKKSAARDEIADLAREAIADPEMSLGLIKRLIALSLPSIKADGDLGGIIKIDPAIRAMAILSLLSVFLDIIPGYRIRALNDTEKNVTVSQMVARQREWEDGLVSSYKRFLEICEKEVVSGSGTLGLIGLKCLTRLLVEKTHFNFSQNIMEVVVRKLGRKEWDESSVECIEAIEGVFRKDTNGQDSLQIVRWIGRIIKSRDYSVHPQVLRCLLSLRLKDEISNGIRASTEKVHKADQGGKLPWKDRIKDPKKSKTKPIILSKKAKKAIKDRKGIEKEIQEAEETVKVEEKERYQTETLKLIFALYFRILKLDHRSILFPAALEGLAKFAHLVNIDFFKDLMNVLRQHIEGKIFGSSNLDDTTPDESIDQGRGRDGEELGDRLFCIVTAFELLSGQGEALNVDLTDFINDLYSILIPLGNQLSLEDLPRGGEQGSNSRLSNLDLLIKALHLVFLVPRSTIPPLRAQAFTKRLLTITLATSSTLAIIKILGFLVKLIHRQPRVKSILILDDEEEGGRRASGRYRAELNDVGLSDADCAVGWEVLVLEKHWDLRVRDSVEELLRNVREISG